MDSVGPGLDWRLDWAGDWTGLDWTGLDYTGLDWTWTGVSLEPTWAPMDCTDIGLETGQETGLECTGLGRNRLG